jgi:hypothetical protein
VTKNNENNTQHSHQSIEKNILSPEKEQIEHSKSTTEHQFLEGSIPEYIYGNEDDEEQEATVDDNL